MIHPILTERLKEKEEHYQKVTEFAKLLPFYKDTIIDKELTADKHQVLANSYKDLIFAWNINWYIARPHNYQEAKECHIGLISIYFNCTHIFGEDFYNTAYVKLLNVAKTIKVYFFDVSNTTFYFKPEEIGVGLEAIYKFYNDTIIERDAKIKEIKRKKRLAEKSS